MIENIFFFNESLQPNMSGLFIVCWLFIFLETVGICIFVDEKIVIFLPIKVTSSSSLANKLGFFYIGLTLHQVFGMKRMWFYVTISIYLEGI